MKIAFVVFVAYAVLGFLYTPGLESLVALGFITASCSPLLLAGRGGEGRTRFVEPGRPIYWGILLLGVFNLTIIAAKVGRSPADLASVDGVVSVAALSTTQRYELEASSGNPLLLALSLWLVFRIGTTVDRMPRWAQIVGVLPPILYSLLTTEKWPMFLVVAFFLTGILTAFPARFALTTAVRYALVIVPGMAGLAALALVLRGAPNLISYLGETLVHYVFAPYSAFGRWLLQESARACCSWGELSIVGPLDAMGFAVRQAGVFQETVTVHGRETNIYTAFRYLVQDFTVLGPFLISCWLAVVHACLKWLGAGAWSRILTVFVIFSALLSLNVTPFVHNSVAFGLFLCLSSTFVASARLRLSLGRGLAPGPISRPTL